MKVYFDTNYWGCQRNEAIEAHRDGTNSEELQAKKLNREFVWEDISGFIPAIYIGLQGMAVDFCIRVSDEEVKAFYHKWKFIMENQAHMRLSEEEQWQIINENPLSQDFSVDISVNGEKLENTSGCSTGYSHMLATLTGQSMEDSMEIQLVQAYGCDEQASWVFRRYFCKWTKKPDLINSVDIDFKPHHKDYPCEAIEIGRNDAGKRYKLTHPVTGQKFALHIYEVMCEKLDRGLDSQLEYPTRYMALSYELIPELPQEKFQIRSIDSGEQPKGIQQGESRGISVLIGGADGPTAYFVAGKRKREKKEERLAASSLYFTLPDCLSWQPVFMEKEREEMRLHVIAGHIFS